MESNEINQKWYFNCDDVDFSLEDNQSTVDFVWITQLLPVISSIVEQKLFQEIRNGCERSDFKNTKFR